MAKPKQGSMPEDPESIREQIAALQEKLEQSSIADRTEDEEVEDLIRQSTERLDGLWASPQQDDFDDDFDDLFVTEYRATVDRRTFTFHPPDETTLGIFIKIAPATKALTKKDGLAKGDNFARLMRDPVIREGIVAAVDQCFPQIANRGAEKLRSTELMKLYSTVALFILQPKHPTFVAIT